MSTKLPISEVSGLQAIIDALSAAVTASGFATSRTAMAGMTVTGSPQRVYLSEGGRSGDFILMAGSIPTVDSNQCIYVASTTPGFYWKRVMSRPDVNFLWCGANPVYSPTVDNWAAFQTAVVFCAAEGRNLYVPAGRYGFTNAPQIQTNLFRTVGFKVYGDGRATSLFDVRSVTTLPQIMIHSAGVAPKDNYYLTLEDIGIVGSIAGDTLRIGEDDYSDPVNVLNMLRVSIQNFDTSSNCRAARMNFLTGCKFDSCQFNGGSGGYVGGAGIALTLRQVEFAEFAGCSFGSAEEGIRFQDGHSYGNVFTTPDIENVKICVRLLGSSGSYEDNSFVGGQYSYSFKGIDAQAGSGTKIFGRKNTFNAPAVASDFTAGTVGLTIY